MLEGEFTRRLVRALRDRVERPGHGVVVRHALQWTGGVPDLSVTVGIKTLWVELKMEGNRPTKLQQDFLDRAGAGAALVTAEKDGKRGIVEPMRVLRLLEFDDLADEIVARVMG